MKLGLYAFATLAGSLALGCTNGQPTDQLMVHNQISSYAGSVSTPDNTQQHHQELNLGQHGITDPAVVQQTTAAAGSIEVSARLHGCTKITFAALGQLLTSRGLN